MLVGHCRPLLPFGQFLQARSCKSGWCFFLHQETKSFLVCVCHFSNSLVWAQSFEMWHCHFFFTKNCSQRYLSARVCSCSICWGGTAVLSSTSSQLVISKQQRNIYARYTQHVLLRLTVLILLNQVTWVPLLERVSAFLLLCATPLVLHIFCS